MLRYKPAIASMSLGRAWVHNLEDKLKRASEAGFRGVEIFYEDLEYLAQEYGEVDELNLLRAANRIREKCGSLALEIIGLQPFMFYEGLTDRIEHEAKIEKLKSWFKIVRALGTDVIQIPSNFRSEGVSGDISTIVNDMIEVADLGSKEEPPVRFVYENLAWGTYVDTWEKLWDVVKRVDRPNFGCCLDTFNIAGSVWADPQSLTGRVEDADLRLEESLKRMIQEIDISKVFYIQLNDAEKLEQPLVRGHPYWVEGQPAKMSWSRNCRLFPYEYDKGAYLPVERITQVLVKDLGYEGWVSMELFSRTMSDPDPSVPCLHAKRGIQAYQKLIEELQL